MEKLNGKVTGPALLAILVVMIFETVLPYIANDEPAAVSTAASTEIQLPTDLIEFCATVKAEHKSHAEVLRDITGELRTISETNIEVLHALRELRRSGP